MGRPRSNHTGLPKYCYVRKDTGAYYLMKPAPDGKLRKAYHRDFDALIADWRATWGPRALADQPRMMSDLLDLLLVRLAERRTAQEIAASTLADYERCTASLRPVWERVAIEDVDAPMLYAWKDARGKQSRTRCNRERTVLSEAFKLAIEKGVRSDNPVEHLKPFKEKPRERYVTDAEFNVVAKHAPPVVQAAMLLAAITGLRQGDILRIRRADFTERDGLLVPTRKTNQPLQFAWSYGLKLAVQAAVGARSFVPMILLATEDGKAYTSSGFRSLWHRAMVAALDSGDLGKRYTFNDLRAKAGSESRDWKLLGHLDQRTFERVYNRLPRRVVPTR
jgi:integrase